MTVAEMIKKTRTDNHMTQQEYGDKFCVTRQTVSSWENEKSMPELQILINICNIYGISLDALLNDDHKYTSTTNVAQKTARILKKLIPVLCAILFIFIVMLTVWKFEEKKKNAEYAASVSELGFVLENGVYVMQDGTTLYKLPNQKLPFLKSDFYLQNIFATCQSDKNYYSIILNRNDALYTFSIDFGLSTIISGTITENRTIEYNNLTESDTARIDASDDAIKNTLLQMVDYYDAVYK